MTELAHYKNNYTRRVGLQAGLAGFVVVGQLVMIAVNLWRHDLTVFWLSGLAVLSGSCVLFIQGTAFLQAKWKRPAIWVLNETLYVVSPMHFRIRMDDIVSWRVERRYWGVKRRLFVALTTLKGKERLIGLEFIQDSDRFLAWLTHLFGPQTQPAATVAAAGA